MSAAVKIGKYLPKPLRYFLRDIYYFSFLGSNDTLIPPKRLASFYGIGDSITLGNHIVKSFISIAGLKPAEKVLDVGCGIGRLALPLAEYLEPKEGGSYEGFDIVSKGIEWCKKKIEPRYPNFHFQVADVYSSLYNPKGRYKASEYKFPFDDNTFDFICLTSVFTHMLINDLQNYLGEISRVLKKESGKCFITYFLLDDQTVRLMKEGKSSVQSSYNLKYMIDEHCYTSRLDEPESMVVYEEAFLREIYRKNNFSIIKPIHYGTWHINQVGLDFQDVIVASKKS